MKAKVIDAKVIEVSGDHIIYKKYENQDGASKKIKKEKVFAITYENGKEVTIYVADSTDPDIQSASDMQMYIGGRRDARMYFKAASNTYVGIAIGAIGGFWAGPVYGPVLPALFATVSEMHAPCLSKQQLSYCFDLCNENYVTGYMKQAGNKKVNNALIGGAFGIAIGIGVLSIFGNLGTPPIESFFN